MIETRTAARFLAALLAALPLFASSAIAAERARINAAGRLPADAKDVTATR